jgi:hypothetical protein
MIRNVHERRLPLTADQAGVLLDSLASGHDRLWPADRWPAMRFARPLDAGAPPFSLRVGALGGHGPIRYQVSDYVPGRKVTFTFHPPRWLAGSHTFEVVPAGDGEVVLRHTLVGRLRGAGRIVWPVALRWLHDALIEDLLDNAARAAGQPPVSTWSPWVRALRALLARRRGRAAGHRVEQPAPGEGEPPARAA